MKPIISPPNAASRKTAGLFADTPRKTAGHFFVMISNPTIYNHIFDITIYYLYTYICMWIYIYMCIYIYIQWYPRYHSHVCSWSHISIGSQGWLPVEKMRRLLPILGIQARPRTGALGRAVNASTQRDRKREPIYIYMYVCTFEI